MKHLVTGIVSLALASCAATTPGGDSNALVQMFQWWNQAYKTEGGFTKESFSNHFTEDTVMIIDGEVKANGIDELVANFHRVRANTDAVEIVLPFIEGFQEGDRIFTLHEITSAAGGERNTGYVMGYAVERDGKISLINFVNTNEMQLEVE